jgi:hypothetical protein
VDSADDLRLRLDQRVERAAVHVDLPGLGGGIFDVQIDKSGLYPFVTHSFASVDMGAVGLLNVGDVAGTMSH